MKSPRRHAFLLAAITFGPLVCPGWSEQTDPASQPYIDAIRSFADTVLAHGRDTYGERTTPLFVDGMHVETLEPVRWQGPDDVWVLSNVASQQPLDFSQVATDWQPLSDEALATYLHLDSPLILTDDFVPTDNLLAPVFEDSYRLWFGDG